MSRNSVLYLMSWFLFALSGGASAIAAEGTLTDPPLMEKVAKALPETAPLTTVTSLTEYGTPKYADGFDHFDYATPEAPMAGRLRQGIFGHFDSLNYILVRGATPTQLPELIYDPLMVESLDELSVVYPLIAEKVSYPEDLSYAIFTLNPKARWHDRTPITAQDVVWTYQVIEQYGSPFLKSTLVDVASATILSDHEVKFTFKTKHDKKPLIHVANLRPLPKHYWTSGGHDISKTTLESPLGSGPYYISRVDEGKAVYYRRVQKYWAQDLPTRKGLYHFDLLQYDWYRDTTVMLEAFFAHSLDMNTEYSSKSWATAYDTRPQIQSGDILKEAFPDHRPQGMQAFFLNHRRAPLNNRYVRAAMIELMDFEWMQKNLMYGQYVRTQSWFPNSSFSQAGKVPSEAEKELLSPWKDQLPDALFRQPWTAPKTSGSGDIRKKIRNARALLKKAGYVIEKGILVNKKTKEPLHIEFLLNWKAMERLVQPYALNLQKAGFVVDIRIVDSAQYQKRLDQLDFDIVSIRLSIYPPPGAELRSYFGSAEADVEGTANYAGIKDPIVDALIEKVIEAPTLEDLQTAARALDRVLLWGDHVIPHWHSQTDRVAWWDQYMMPEKRPYYDLAVEQTWWAKPSE